MRRGVFRSASSVRAGLAGLTFGLMQAVTPSAAASEVVQRGKELYLLNGCHSCHGTVGQGGERSGAPKLAPEPYPFEAFKVLIRTPREQMPRYDPKFLSDEQLQAIHQYLASIPKGPAARDIPVLQALPR